MWWLFLYSSHVNRWSSKCGYFINLGPWLKTMSSCASAPQDGYEIWTRNKLIFAALSSGFCCCCYSIIDTIFFSLTLLSSRLNSNSFSSVFTPSHSTGCIDISSSPAAWQIYILIDLQASVSPQMFIECPLGQRPVLGAQQASSSQCPLAFSLPRARTVRQLKGAQVF